MKESSALYATLWKHFVIRRRQIILTSFEVIIPIVIIAFIAYARSQVPGFAKVYVNDTTRVQPFDGDSLKTRITVNDITLYYAPSTEFTDELVRNIQLKLGIYNDDVKGFPREKDLFNYYHKNSTSGTNVAIVFNGGMEQPFPKQLSFNLKIYKESVLWNTKDLFLESPVYVPGMGSEKYIEDGFLPVQFALELSYIEMATNKSLDVKFEFEEFPYPPHVSDSGMNDVFLKCLPLLTILSFLFVCSSALSNVVQEKASGIKELMKINGLKSWCLWTGWFLNGFALNLISIIVIVVLLKGRFWGVEYAPLEYCHWFILFLLLSLYCSATISFMLLFSTFFNRATLASVMGIVLWLLGFLLLTSVSNRTMLQMGLKRIFVLMPTVALYYGYDVISVFELREVNLNCSNVFDLPTESADDFSIGFVLLYLAFETIIYFVLTLYLDQILPGPYGIPKPWYFMLFPKRKLRRSNSIGSVESQSETSDAVEMLTVNNSDIMIRVHNLTKDFANVTAVSKLNIDIYKGTITSLLGHNGAGKTTTMSMMTGMINPSSGDVYIDGISITEDSERARKLISVCPQHNLLFKELTVWQHLIFFGLLRGLSKKQSEILANDLLENKLNLSSKRHDLVGALSGGMKRKLALGMALMGNPKLLVLDEPTAGIDIEGRREIWDLIHSYRLDHTILISTHFLEEADELSDRIAIMDKGVLVCYGTSMFLRDKYNMGYTCSVIFDDCKLEDLANTVKRHIPEATLISNTENDIISKVTAKDVVHFVLPNGAKQKFAALFAEMHRRKLELGISSFKLTNNTLEDIVLKVMSTVQTEEEKKKSNTSRSKFVDRPKKNNFLSQFRHLVKIHINFLLKIRFYVITMVCLFFTFTCLTLYANRLGYQSVSKDGTTLALHLNVYGETKVYFTINDRNNRLEDVYRDEVLSEGSVPLFVNNTFETIVQLGIENIAQYKKRVIVGSEFVFQENELKRARILYSNNALHGAPISLNLVTNAILRYLSGDDEYLMSVSNTPLHAAGRSYIKVEQSANANMLMWLFFFPLGPLFLMSILLIYPTYMYLNEIDVLQKLCGIPGLLCWVKNYIIDFVFVSVICLLLVIVFLVVNVVTERQTFELFAILLLYCAVNIPFGYLFTRLKSVETAIFRFISVSMLLGLVFSAALLIAETIEASSFWIRLFQFLVLCVPQASLTYLMGNFAVKVADVHNWDIRTKSEINFFCQSNPLPCCEPNSDECASWRSAIAYDFVRIYCHLFAGLVFFFIVVFMDYGIGFNYILEIMNKYRTSAEEIPESGCVVRTVIDRTDSSREPLFTVQGISKKYLKRGRHLWNWNWIQPVDRLTFTVAKGECFGLLGVNGAGKTTTFRILTRTTRRSDGWISSTSIEPLRLGYCPQGNALIERFTPLELVQAFANLGNNDVSEEDAQNLLAVCCLTKYANVPSGTLSGGNKRKLNMAIAIASCPDLLLLDEPSTGVDLFSRRELWNVINDLKHKSSVILTSHSMEECEVLCDRISVMKSGKIVESGTIDELKQKYCVGHLVTIKFESDANLNKNADGVMKELHKRFASGGTRNVIEKDRSFSTVEVQIKQSNWEEIFVFMEDLKGREDNSFGIIDYFVKEVSFEDVFLTIANS